MFCCCTKIITLFLAYATLIENDSNPEVRRAVLSCIAPSAKTLPKIVGRTKDVKETVRKLAYQVNKSSVLCRPVLKKTRSHNLKIPLKNIWHVTISAIEIFMDRV